MRKFFTWFASIFFQRRADDVSAVFVMAARFLSRLGWLPDLRGKEMPTVTTCYDPPDYPRKLHVKHYEFHLGFFLTKFHFYCMIAGHCTRSDSSQFLLPFQGPVLQNTDHIACKYAHKVIYWSLAHNCCENQNDWIILPATQAQCAQLWKWPTYNSFRLVPLLEVINAPIQVPDIFYLAVSFKFLDFSLQICLLFVPEMSDSLMSYIVQIIYIVSAWILYPLHFSLLPLI